MLTSGLRMLCQDYVVTILNQGFTVTKYASYHARYLPC